MKKSLNKFTSPTLKVPGGLTTEVLPYDSSNNSVIYWAFEDTPEASFILAQYKNGRMDRVGRNDMRFETGLWQRVIFPSAIKSAKIFFWDINKTRPLSADIEIN